MEDPVIETLGGTNSPARQEYAWSHKLRLEKKKKKGRKRPSDTRGKSVEEPIFPPSNTVVPGVYFSFPPSSPWELVQNKTSKHVIISLIF